MRQIARYEAGDQQPVLSFAAALADALGISLAQLAGQMSHDLELGGTWWAAWQTWVGMSYDGPVVSGYGAIARTESQVCQVIEDLIKTEL